MPRGIKKVETVTEYVTLDVVKLLIEEAVAPLRKRQVAPSIHKVEDFNGEVAPPPYDGIDKLAYTDKLQSARNAASILPPNLIHEGRHSKENIGALCGFRVDDDMWDDIYTGFAHEV